MLQVNKETKPTLSGVTAHVREQGLRTTRMLVQPVGHVHDHTFDDDPKIILLVVLGDLLHRELLVGDLEITHVLRGSSRRGVSGGRGRRGGGSGHGRGGLTDGSRGLAAAGGTSGSSPLDGDLAGLRGIDVQRDLLETLLRGAAAGEQLLEEVLAGGVASNTAVDDAAKERRATKTVGTVDTTSKLTASVEAVEGLALGVEDLSLVVDLDTAHGEVEDGLHDGDVEGVVDGEGPVVEELLVPGVLLLALGNLVVLVKGLLEGSLTAADLLGELSAGHLLHETTARVVAGVEVKDVGGLAVEDEANRPLALGLFLEDLAGHVVTVAELVGETLAVGVEEDTTLTTEGYTILAKH